MTDQQNPERNPERKHPSLSDPRDQTQTQQENTPQPLRGPQKELPIQGGHPDPRGAPEMERRNPARPQSA